ncbi:hypothetical protein EsDP_00007146 [Epichloe bromicola]|uniref:Cytochrome P450 monooxygenase n=1 Tax=Epichloe bromicola TaxID=79588 RepID=A0ABQ0CZQ8_9HYPO
MSPPSFLVISERKIDSIENRLGNIEVLLKSIASPAAPVQSRFDLGALENTPPTGSSGVPTTTASTGDFDSSEDESAYGGDTGLVAHTAFASEFLERAVKRTSLREVNPKMAAALINLSQLVEMQRRRLISHGPRFPLQRPVPPGGISKLPMPPMQAVVNVLWTACFLEKMLSLKRRDTSRTIALLGYLVAGHETTSAVLRWGMKYLTANEQVQTLLRQAVWKAHQEAKEQHQMPIVEEILKANNPYLDVVIEEMLGHSRVAPVTFIQAVTDTEILGQHIPKGTTIGFLGNGPGVMMLSIPVDSAKRSEAVRAHMHKTDLFDSADISEFVSERWLTTKTTERRDDEMVFDPSKCPSQAFGLGPRGCFGKKLAYMEIRTFLTLVFWEFKLEPVKPELAADDEMISLTRTPKNVYIKLTKMQECE